MSAATEDGRAHKKARLGAEDTVMDDAPKVQKFIDGCVHDLMPLYYGRLFPCNEMYRWLAYGNDNKHPQADGGFFQKREFCFTLEGDIFCRYQSFKDGTELHAALKDRVPEKIDLGPIYNVDPARRNAYTALGGDRVFAPVERELVFDVDMTDYDDMRTCCSGAGICHKCWPLMTIAIKVIDRGLREDFGFEHVLWVYSGRRGVHAWVCDQRARGLSNEARSAVAEYFSVYKGGENKRVAITNRLHPTLRRVYDDILRPFWMDHILPQQALLETPESAQKVLSMIPDEGVQETLMQRWQQRRASAPDSESLSVSRWMEVEREVERAAKSKQGKDVKAMYNLRRCPLEIVFAHTYPRLDVEVSKHMNHLLKAPFCVHPKTGRVCVPIDPSKCEQFDPLEVPTVAQLLNELDASSGDSTSSPHARTSMGTYVEIFKTTFLDGLMSNARDILQEKAKAAAVVSNAQKPMEW